MNKFVKKELEKVNDLLPYWDDSTTYIIINSESRAVSVFEIGKKFTIKLENYIINQPPNFTLSENWNGGTFPPEEVLDIEIMRVVGKMVGVKAKGHNNGIEWEGWLPSKGFKVI